MTCLSKQERYARERFEHTTLYRAWFRAWSDYEAMWFRIMCEPEEKAHGVG